MNLQELEARLRTLIEVHLIGALPGQRPEDLLVHRLTEAMQAGASASAAGERTAPNVYTLLAHPDSVGYWRDQALIETLVDILNTAAEQAQLRFDTAPSITIAEDATLHRAEYRLIASYRAESLAETMDMKTGNDEAQEEQDNEGIPENAYVIIEGVRVFQLGQAVVNIGRRLDNTLVIDDPRVSRNHAQIRAIKGRYVLFDLNSTGGTFVNGQRANQTVLYPGDVISLAGVSLIFGQDNPSLRSDLSDTAQSNSATADRSTAVIRTMAPSPKKEK